MQPTPGRLPRSAAHVEEAVERRRQTRDESAAQRLTVVGRAYVLAKHRVPRVGAAFRLRRRGELPAHFYAER